MTTHQTPSYDTPGHQPTNVNFDADRPVHHTAAAHPSRRYTDMNADRRHRRVPDHMAVVTPGYPAPADLTPAQRLEQQALQNTHTFVAASTQGLPPTQQQQMLAAQADDGHRRQMAERHGLGDRNHPEHHQTAAEARQGSLDLAAKRAADAAAANKVTDHSANQSGYQGDKPATVMEDGTNLGKPSSERLPNDPPYKG